MHVVGTAGHVDHGKTSLLRALTGMEPSRLTEERRRGMTTQLGFVWMKDDNASTVGIVDVPGHADYRLSALTGMSAVDAFLFTCACDDGWMPQSEEHLWALASLGVRYGVVALTKADLVDDDCALSLKAELEVRFFEALGREIAVVPFSAKTGAGLADVRRALYRDLAALPPAKDLQSPKMFVDRAFTVEGKGTVITGTLRDGQLQERQMVEVLPSGRKAEIRAIHTYGEATIMARPNSRVALRFSGLSPDDLPKDSQIIDPAHHFVTSAADLRLFVHKAHLLNPKKNPDVIVIHGGVKTKAKLIAIGPASAAPAWHVRLKLTVPRRILFAEPCLVISAGGDKIIGAGRVLDEYATTSVSVASNLLDLIDDFSETDYLLLNLMKCGAYLRRDLPKRTGFLALAELPGGVVELDQWLADPRRVDEWCASILRQIERRHKSHPADDGLPESALVKDLALDADLVRALIRELKRQKRVQQTGPFLKIFGYAPRANQTTSLTAALTELAATDGDAAPSLRELGIEAEEERRTLARFVMDGKIVRFGPHHIASALSFQTRVHQVVAHLSKCDRASVADIRDQLQLGRKYVVLLLEAMDHAKITERQGSDRVLTLAYRRISGATV